jgi:hypothetical protein
VVGRIPFELGLRSISIHGSLVKLLTIVIRFGIVDPYRYFGWYVVVGIYLAGRWWKDPSFDPLEDLVEAAEYADRWAGNDC